MRKFRSSTGSLSLESTLLIAFLVLVSAVTLGGLGKAIACTYSKESAAIDGNFVGNCGAYQPSPQQLGKIRISYADPTGESVPSSDVSVSDAVFTPAGSSTSPGALLGTYAFTASAPGYYSRDVTFPVAPDGTVLSSPVVLVPVPVAFTLTATDADTGLPLVGGTLAMADSDGKAVADSPQVADAAGLVTFTVSKTDTYTVTATKDGYASQVSQFFVRVGGSALTRSGNLSAKALPGSAAVTVKASGGAALAGASVVLGTHSATADGSGVAGVAGLAAGTYSGTASATGYVSRAFTLTVSAGQQAAVTLTLSPVATMSDAQAFDSATWPTGWTRSDATYVRLTNAAGREHATYGVEAWANSTTRRTVNFYRDYDLTGYATATLSFWENVSALAGGTDYARVEYSTDSGATWTQLDNRTAVSGWAQQSYSLPVGGNVRVRFSASVNAPTEYADWDEITVHAVGPQ